MRRMSIYSKKPYLFSKRSHIYECIFIQQKLLYAINVFLIKASPPTLGNLSYVMNVHLFGESLPTQRNASYAMYVHLFGENPHMQ